MKKILNKLAVLTLFIAMLPLNSCFRYVEGYDIDPNNALDAPIETIMRSAQIGLIQSLEGEDARMVSMWTQQFTGVDRQYASIDAYTVSAADYDWFNKYYETIEQANVAIRKADQVNNRKIRGMMKVIKAQMLGSMTALWGDIPFTESNQFPLIKTPKYDNQTTVVYPGVQTLLDEAIVDLGGTGTIVGTSDLFFGGNASRWIAVAYTLKARFYMHVGNYAAAITAANSGVSATANDMLAKHTTGTYGTDLNLWNAFLYYERGGYMDASDSYLSRILGTGAGNRNNAKTNEATRRAFIFDAALGFADLSYGDGTPGTGGAFDAAASYPLVTYKENQLILAEAKIRQGDLNALTNLNNVRAALATEFAGGTYTAYVLTDFDAAGIAGAASRTQAQSLLLEIMEERYVSLFAQIEVYNDLRRANNPLGLTAKNASGFPQRFFYPQSEINANPNTPALAAADLFAKTRANGGTK